MSLTRETGSDGSLYFNYAGSVLHKSSDCNEGKIP
jgi:hypothetical protein